MIAWAIVTRLILLITGQLLPCVFWLSTKMLLQSSSSTSLWALDLSSIEHPRAANGWWWWIQVIGRFLHGRRRLTSGVRSQTPSHKMTMENAERMQCTIINMVRSMVLASNLRLSFWGDASVYATYILNRSKMKLNPGRVIQWRFWRRRCLC